MKFSLSEFVMFSCKTRIGERSFSSITSDLLDFHTNKTEQYLQTNVLCLDESSRVACNSGETQTRKLLLLFGRDRLPGKILKSVARVGKLLSSETLLYPNISS